MNERIKLLAEQAGAVEAKDITNIPRALSLNGEEIEKFAELIVTQLVLSVSTNSDGITNASDFYRYQKIFNKRLGIE